jgi:hypothetical protein
MPHRPPQCFSRSHTQRAMPRIVAWTPRGGDQEQTLARTIGDLCETVCCRTEQQLWEEVAHPRTRLFVFELGVVEPSLTGSLVSLIREWFPHTRILGFGWLTPALALETLVCAKAGLDGIALQGYDDVGAMIRRALADEKEAVEVVFQEISRRFSSSSCFSRRTSAFCIPPYFARQR